MLPKILKIIVKPPRILYLFFLVLLFIGVENNIWATNRLPFFIFSEI